MKLQLLKDAAAKVEYTKYHHMVGAVKLEEELRKFCDEIGTTLEEVISSLVPSTEEKVPADLVEKFSKVTFTQAEKENNQKSEEECRKDAMRLIRCIISCNNKNKVSYTGEIFCVGNSVLPELKKFIPFNTPTHVPKILLNMIEEKQYQQYKGKKVHGIDIKESYLTPEYNIRILPPLTTEEFNAIKQKQLAEGFDGK